MLQAIMEPNFGKPLQTMSSQNVKGSIGVPITPAPEQGSVGLTE